MAFSQAARGKALLLGQRRKGNRNEKNIARDRGGRHGSDAGDGDAGIFDLSPPSDNRNKHLGIRHAKRKDDG